jgi:hypothetical protein
VAAAYATGDAVAFYRVPKVSDQLDSIQPLGTITTPCACEAIGMSEKLFTCACQRKLHVYRRQANGAAQSKPLKSLRLSGDIVQDSLAMSNKRVIVGLREPKGAMLFDDVYKANGALKRLEVHENSTADAFAAAVAIQDDMAIVTDPHMRKNGALVKGVEFAGSAFTYCREGGKTRWGQCRDRLPGFGYRVYLGQRMRLEDEIAVFRNQHTLEAYGRSPLSGPWKRFFRTDADPHEEIDLRDGRLVSVAGAYSSERSARVRLFHRKPTVESQLDDAASAQSALGTLQPTADVTVHDVGNAQARLCLASVCCCCCAAPL